jgi:predicted dehydrogenase
MKRILTASKSIPLPGLMIFPRVGIFLSCYMLFTYFSNFIEKTHMNEVNWGIVGCGNVTEVKSGPAFNKIKGSRLMAVMRRNGELARDYAQRHNVPRWYDNADELIDDPGVNAVYIATPPGSHAQYAIRAMQAGKPVYVEKPMALNHKECLEMISVSERTGVPLFIAYYRRMLPGFLKVKEIVESGTIGIPKFVSIKFFMPPSPEDHSENLPWRVIPEISGGGYIFDLGSHQLDLIDYLLGPIVEWTSLAFNQGGLYGPEDFVAAGFRCENNVAGHGVWSFAAPGFLQEDTIEIAGDKGKITLSCFDFTDIILEVGGEIRCFENNRPEHVQQRLIETIVSELQGRGQCPSTGITAARTSKLLDDIVNFGGRQK